MANPNAAITLLPKGYEQVDPEMDLFLEQVKTYQTADDLAAMAGNDHISRLHRPGAKYFNMNPFEVLGLTHKATPEEVRGAYRKLSVRVHPDKNPGNDRAQAAFEAVKAAHDRLQDEGRLEFCVRICSAAEDAVVRKVQSQKKKLRKDGQPEDVPEDDPNQLAVAVKIMIVRMFTEFEQRKKQMEKKEADEKKAMMEAAAEREFMEALKKQEEKIWEKSRQKRVAGWRHWEAQGGHKSKIPKTKEEKREDGSSGYNAHGEGSGQSYKKDWR